MPTATPMTITTANIISGPCTSFTVDGTAVGGTTGGVVIEKKQTFADLEIDQSTGTAKKVLTKETYTVTTTVSESTLQNLQVAWGLSTAPVSGTTPASLTLNLGVESGAAIEHALVFVGPCPAGTSSFTTRTYTLNRAVQVTATKHEMLKNKEAQYALAFDCLPDFTKTGKEYGTVVDQ